MKNMVLDICKQRLKEFKMKDNCFEFVLMAFNYYGANN